MVEFGEICVTLGPNWRLSYTTRLSLNCCPPPCHTYPAARSGTTWNGLVLYMFHTSGHVCYLPLLGYSILDFRFNSSPKSISAYWLPHKVYTSSSNSSFIVLMLCFKAGLLGCEAVLSSMALMQASSITAPKKMMSPLGLASGHGSAQRDAQDRGMQGHMILPTSMTCPPLVRRHPSSYRS